MALPETQPDHAYADRRVLVHWHARPGPPRYSRKQIVAGPFCEDVFEGADAVSLKTPAGPYDIRALLDRIPPHQRPEVLLVTSDSTRAAVPLNLGAFDGPKALVMGDTHHLEGPLRFMLGYIHAERFDILVGNHLPQHLHYFARLGRGRAIWVPGAWVRNYDIPFTPTRTGPPVLAGSFGAYHPRRVILHSELTARGLEIAVHSAIPQDEAARLHAQAPATINCSLNGDLNMRVLEAIGHGGLLLTDRLRPEAGLERLFVSGETLVIYDGARDLAAKIRHFLDHPDEGLAIARRGYDAYRRFHHPDRKAEQILSALFGDRRFPPSENLDARVASLGADDTDALRERLLVYEHLQERNRTATSPMRVRGMPEVAARTFLDLADLTFVEMSRPASVAGDRTHQLLKRMGYGERIGHDDDPSADILLARSASLTSPAFAAATAAARPEAVVVTNAVDAAQAALDEKAMGPLGYARNSAEPPVFVRSCA